MNTVTSTNLVVLLLEQEMFGGGRQPNAGQRGLVEGASMN